MKIKKPDETSVFLNFPYDPSYEQNYVALLTGVIGLGRKPWTALEIVEQGEGRLRRIFERMEYCKASIHDLSPIGRRRRFNMAFELGLAFALKRYQERHDYHVLILEKMSGRMRDTLSDLDGFQPLIHNGSPRQLLLRLLDAFGTTEIDPPIGALVAIQREVTRAAERLKKKHRRKDIYTPTIFRSLRATTLALVRDIGLIAPGTLKP